MATARRRKAVAAGATAPESLFRVAFELGIDGMFIAEPDGRQIAANPRLSELTGFSNEELLGMSYLALVCAGPSSPAPVRLAVPLPDAILTSESYVRRKDGTAIPVEISRRLLPDDRILGTIRDISERKRAEEWLRTSETRYRALVESQIDLVSRYRGDTILTYVNDAYCRFFGRSREDLVGHTFMFMIAPEYREIVQKETEKLAGDPNTLVVGEYVNYRADGRECSIQWIVRSIVDEGGRVLELQAVGRDITELKQTEEALRQANLVVESSPVVLFRWSAAPGWPVEYVSRNVTQLGYGVEELLSGTSRYLALVHPDDQDRIVREVAAYSDGGVDRFQQEYRIVTKAGEVRWVDARVAIQRDGDAGVMHYQGILVDITERKGAEHERSGLQAQLNQASKMESVGRLAGGVAHDFNNMLTAILGHTQLAMEKTSPADPVRDDLNVIEQSALRSATIVRQLLAFARKQTAAPKVLDLNDTVTGMLKMLRRIIGEDIEFAWLPGPGLWPVKVDPSQVDQLLANLCVNARHAISGVGTITVESANAVLDEPYCETHPGATPGDFVMLAVSDDGCGMEKRVLDHIFEPFFTTGDASEGTGLGLATVYGIVKQNEGFISVYSEPGIGTTFKVYLPRHAGEAVEHRPEPADALARGNGETILLVEDEASILRLARAMLEELGYRVLAAGTPGEALRIAANDPGGIALLLTDVVMPEMDGRTLAAMVGEIHPAMKCLFSSGYTSNVIATRGILDESVHFLEKPFNMRSLAAKVREALDEDD